MTLFLDHSDDLRLGEAAFPHCVCSVVMKQTLHQNERRSGGQVSLLQEPSRIGMCNFESFLVHQTKEILRREAGS
ncbi:hypothetical protein H5394_14685 [Paracoccus sp. MC1862]|nr:MULTISPECIES: hypothetical protein [unclassified Paracoccus (in: a-proteobacteria)]MBB1492735.1 hypothetical protein [Paracoccus sp. MC1854]MBB1499354.1 hypothetical protein [Paracoccus sp. MC1862]QQO46538.1 hypothetical protein JGR78_01410 [Paracoccus sp. MC1862]